MDDLNCLVHEQLPRLAYQIMRPLLDMPDSALGGRWNFVRSADWAPLDKSGRLLYAGPTEYDGMDGYHYKGCWPAGDGGHLMDQWWIGFFGFRSAGLGEIPDSPVVVTPSDVRLVQVDKTANYGPGFIDYQITRHEEQDVEHEQSIGAIAELEYKRSMRALVKGGIPGIGEAEVESTQELRARVEAQAHEAWRSSDTLASTVAASYQVYPYHQLTVTVKRGEPGVQQTIPLSHGLECAVRIEIYNALGETYHSIEDTSLIWRGLNAGSPRLSPYFAQHPVGHTDEWERPAATFDLVITGERVRYSDTQYDHKPIPGQESLAAEYVQAKLNAI